MMTFNIIELNESGLKFKKEVDVYEGLERFYRAKLSAKYKGS